MGVENLANIIAWKWDATPLFSPQTGVNGFIVQDDGSGPAITFWDIEGVTQPTNAEVLAFEDDWLTGFPASVTALKKDKAKSSIDTAEEYNERAIIAVALLSKDEVNILRAQIVGTAELTVDPPNLANGAGFTKADIAVAGAAFGDVVQIAAPYSLQGIICTGYVHAADTIGVRLQNATGGAVNLGSGTWKIVVQRLDALAPRTVAQMKTAAKNIIDANGG